MCSPALIEKTAIISAFQSFAFIFFHLPILHYSVLTSTGIYILYLYVVQGVFPHLRLCYNL